MKQSSASTTQSTATPGKEVKKASAIGKFTLLKRPEITEKPHSTIVAINEEKDIKVEDPEADPKAKKKIYKEKRAVLFSPEELQELPDTEDRNPHIPSEIDLDYDRFLPIFMSQNAMNEQVSGPHYPPPPYYAPPSYPPPTYTESYTNLHHARPTENFPRYPGQYHPSYNPYL